MTQLRTFGYGGGVQSTGALVLAAQGRLDYRTFLFCHTGEDSEDPATLRYLVNYAQPYAAANGIALHVIRRTIQRNHAQPTILEAIEDGRDIIPLYVLNDAGKYPHPQPLSRTCTSDWKAKVSAKWQKDHGATPDNPGVHGLGISLDEYERMRSSSGFAWQVLDYPLVTMRLTRQSLRNIIQRAGLPIPPKSACFFCPFHKVRDWREMKRYRPALFQKVVDIEAAANVRRAVKGQRLAYMHRSMRPLDEVVKHDQAEMDFDDGCESGFCMT